MEEKILGSDWLSLYSRGVVARPSATEAVGNSEMAYYKWIDFFHLHNSLNIFILVFWPGMFRLCAGVRSQNFSTALTKNAAAKLPWFNSDTFSLNLVTES